MELDDLSKLPFEPVPATVPSRRTAAAGAPSDEGPLFYRCRAGAMLEWEGALALRDCRAQLVQGHWEGRNAWDGMALPWAPAAPGVFLHSSRHPLCAMPGGLLWWERST